VRPKKVGDDTIRRDEGCDLGPSRPSGTASNTFSPLFVGMRVATPRPAVPGDAHGRFQSPIRRDEGCDPEVPGGLGGGVGLSVPYSSG